MTIQQRCELKVYETVQFLKILDVKVPNNAAFIIYIALPYFTTHTVTLPILAYPIQAYLSTESYLDYLIDHPFLRDHSYAVISHEDL